MFNSIQQFETAGIKNLRKAEDEFIRTRDMANFINAIKEVVLHLGLDVVAETLENYDEAIRKSPKDRLITTTFSIRTRQATTATHTTLSLTR